ncbi:FAD-binding protein [Bradyrhizobium diazoefficiens]|nr:FAD-binding protein [Bradyrhizobium diazoefficiens]QQN62204.1 FAD-binding protein [Bradyrhizobium diazoefficiens]
MAEILFTDVLVVGEGCAGQTAALTASEEGCDVVLLSDGRPPSTAISTGFLTYAAHEGFTRNQLIQAMAEVTGKGVCDQALLRRLVDEAPKEMSEAIAAYRIPVERVERGLRARRALGKSGRELLSGFGTEDQGRDSVEDMTGLMMEFSSTHGTALYAQLRKAVKASPKITRLRGSALVLEPGATAVGALVDGKSVTVAARAVILATGGLQGLYEFTDTPETLTGDGHGMAAEAGAALIDLEFIQFYPLAVREDGIPPIFLYPDFPKLSTLVNDQGENVLRKHLGEASQYLADLHNWDQLSALIQSEIVEGRRIFVDFRETKSADWAPDSLTGTFLSRFIPNFHERPVQVAPSSHYTIGGLKVDVDGRTSLPKVYAAGEIAGGVHGANRHGGTALVEAITFGRIAGRHAARSLNGDATRTNASLLPPERKAGAPARVAEAMTKLRHANQMALGPIRDRGRLEEAGIHLVVLRDEVRGFGWNGYREMQEVLRVERGIMLSDCMRQAMLRRTESRGTHARSDFPQTSDAWLKKQVVRVVEGMPRFADAPI